MAGDTDRPAFIGPQTESVECYICGRFIGKEDFHRVEGMDVSLPDEYYPDMVAVCPSHEVGDGE